MLRFRKVIIFIALLAALLLISESSLLVPTLGVSQNSATEQVNLSEQGSMPETLANEGTIDPTIPTDNSELIPDKVQSGDEDSPPTASLPEQGSMPETGEDDDAADPRTGTESPEVTDDEDLPNDNLLNDGFEDKQNFNFGIPPSPQRMLMRSSINNNRISNDYLEIAVQSSGRFTFGTTGGNPNNDNDNNKKLLYGHPSSQTSFTTIRIDDTNHIFNSANTSFYDEPGALRSETSSSINEYLEVKQILQIINSPYTNREDIIQIKYRVTNNDTQSHNIGTRIMLDTMLGDNDGAPFRVPGHGNVTKEMELSGNDIPEYWQAFDSLDNPRIISTGTLYRSAAERPDIVKFAYWRAINSTEWDYTINPMKAVTGDSAIAMYWNPIEIGPGETREFTTYYGIGDFAAQDLRPPLALRIQAPQELIVNDSQDGYSPNPFTVTAYVWNNGSGPALNSMLHLELPEGLTLVSGEKDVALGDIAPGQEKTVTWQVEAANQDADTTLIYQIMAAADEVESKLLSISIKLPITSSLSRTAGIEYEQTTSPQEISRKPVIKSIRVETIDAQKGHYRLSIENFTCDRAGSPFFFWKAEEGSFSNVSDDVKSVDFTADQGTEGKTVTVTAYIGDNLGYIGFAKVRVAGRQ